MDKFVPSKYNDMQADNVWLHRIANETAETNFLLKKLIELYMEDKPEHDDLEEKLTGGAFGGEKGNTVLDDVFNKD